jgi:hypothetical protein
MPAFVPGQRWLSEAEPELGVGQGAVGAGGVEGEAGVGRVDPGEFLAGGDGVTLVDGQALDGAGHLGGHQDLRGLDVPGGHDEARVLALAAAGAEGGGEDDGDDGGSSHSALHARAPLRRGPDGGVSGASPRRVSSSR